MNTHKAVIVDYGMGNLFSIKLAIEYLGCSAQITDDTNIIACAERLILPGVGAFGEAMRILKQKGLIEAIYKFVSTERPLLGICLGMQLLMTEGEEFGLFPGLGLIKGRVIRLSESSDREDTFKVPHIGWNKIFIPEGNSQPDAWGKTLLQGIPDEAYFYFVHSYFVIPEQHELTLAETKYGKNKFCSAINYRNISACQFHPERSAAAGLKLYKNFLFN